MMTDVLDPDWNALCHVSCRALLGSGRAIRPFLCEELGQKAREVIHLFCAVDQEIAAEVVRDDPLPKRRRGQNAV